MATKKKTKTAKKKARDIEKGYTNAQFAAKLRRLADAVETGKRFSIQVAGERIAVPAPQDALARLDTVWDGYFQYSAKQEAVVTIDAGMHARSAFGVASLPRGTCVEIEMIVEVA